MVHIIINVERAKGRIEVRSSDMKALENEWNRDRLLVNKQRRKKWLELGVVHWKIYFFSCFLFIFERFHSIGDERNEEVAGTRGCRKKIYFFSDFLFIFERFYQIWEEEKETGTQSCQEGRYTFSTVFSSSLEDFTPSEVRSDN